jgi:hypothetical protein
MRIQPNMHTIVLRPLALLSACFCFFGMASASSAPRLQCDESLKQAFKNDANTRVHAVKRFAPGDDLNLDGKPSGLKPKHSVCVVKLLIGPGNPGPAGAPSTSQGIGIEVWLPEPARWNKKFHALGGGGWNGMPKISSSTELDGTREHFGGNSPMRIADEEGAVSAVTDTGHVGGASFAFNPDGTINKTLWNDFAARGSHEMALKTKELIAAYYEEPLRYSYFEGVSTGGQQAFKHAQAYPEDFDGILAGFAPLGWTQLTVTSMAYPQIVIERELQGAHMTDEQLRAVSAAAVSECDATVIKGHHDGYITDSESCRYDPTQDRGVLCPDSGGTDETSACVSLAQARVINMIWYGQTTDGKIPPPEKDNGYGQELGPTQLWYGISRGIDIAKTAGSKMLTGNGVAQLALSLQDPRLGDTYVQNASGNGTAAWRNLGYADLWRAQREGLRLQPQFAHINTDNPDLKRFRDRGGKLLYTHGSADAFIPVQGSDYYYRRVAKQMGGYAETQRFFRYFRIPGGNHDRVPGPVPGRTGVSPPPDPPIPDQQRLYGLLIDWVEHGRAPDRIVGTSSNRARDRSACSQRSSFM